MAEVSRARSFFGSSTRTLLQNVFQLGILSYPFFGTYESGPLSWSLALPGGSS